MKTVSVAGATITIDLTSDERRIVRQSVVMYEAGVGVSSEVRNCRPDFLAGANIEHVVEAMRDRPSMEQPIAHGNDQDFSNEVDSSIALNASEWGVCLYVLNALVYGCVVSDTDLFYVIGYYRSELLEVMNSLHNEISKSVYSLAARHKVARRKRSDPDR
jgi:hypothetical protein